MIERNTMPPRQLMFIVASSTKYPILPAKSWFSPRQPCKSYTVNTFALEHWQSRRREICFSMMRTPKPSPALDWCLFLDVDGTLVEFADSPLETFVDDELKEVLRQVAERLGGAVALVSGRSLQYLDSVFAPLRLPAAGLHGVERRKASGAIHGASFVDTRLNPARSALKSLVAAHPGTLVEDKGRTLAVHYRMAPQYESAVREALAAI